MKGDVKRILMKNGIYIVVLLAVVFFMSGPSFAFDRGASRLVEEGNAAFREGSLAEAAARYEDARKKNPDSPIPLFNLGVVLYEQGNFSAALAAFQNIETVNEELLPLVHYNQGNALARMGEMEESENPQEALECYLKSVAAYKRVLSIDPGHMESAYNIEVVRTWIKDLVERMEKTSGTGSSTPSSSSGQNEQKRETSPGEQNEEQKAGQPEQNNGTETSPQQPDAIPSIPKDDITVPRDETAQAILREEQQRREAEARIRGGLSADDRPTW
jgi:Ca-activated chloride channel family protein